MSGSTARKVQPFTISTKLSLPKCSLEFPRDSCTDIPLAALNNHDLHQNLNECVSLYLAQTSLEPAGGRFESATPIEEVVASDDCINSNSLSRSIKKITLSNWHGKASLGEEGIFRGPSHASAEKNCNNNNCRAGKAQFKVFLRKEVEPKEEKQDARSPQAGDNFLVGRVASFLTASSVAASPWKECAKNTKPGTVVEQKPCIESSTGVADLSKWSLLLAQFNCDMVQAEKWVRGKLHDLKDGCRFQEWEQIAQILQRDMKDFENTIIKLNRMGEQLMIQPKSSTEIERRLQTLQEQWQLLKHMATNQTKTVVGFKNLQEFNQKAEQLEDWIRQKEEKPLLAILLQEKADKVQITRRILDLKQEELQFQAVHEELNSLAHKLEKQGKSEGRSITTRRKYLNKMWLQLQRTLKEHHETLQQALEAAAFLQQADVLLSAIHAKLRHLYGERKQNESESSPDLDIRDIASQVMMLDVTMSQLISLHPSLTAQVSLKHQDIKESWAQLQQLLRSDNPPQLALTKESIDSSSPNQVLTTITKNPGQDAEEKLVREVQKDTPEIMAECVTSQENNSDLSGRETITSDTKSRRKFVRQSKTLKDLPQQEAHLQDICQDADGEIQQLLHTDHRWSPEMEDALEELGELWAELKKRHQENGMALQEIDTALQLVGELEAAECWLETVAALLSEPRATKNLDDLHRDLQKIGTLKNKAGAWATKIHTLQEEMQMVPSSEHTAAAVIQRKMERVKEKLACVQEALQRQATDLHDSLILMEFLQNVQMDQTLNQRSQIKAAPNQFSSPESLHLALAQSAQQGNSKDMSTPLKELQEAVEMLNNVVKERERALKAVTETESQECFTQVMKDKEEIRLSWVTSQIETIRERTETLAQDIIQAERSFTTVKSEMDLLDVQDVQKRQEEIESDMSQLEGNIEELERAVTHLVQASDESRRILEILEAWKDLQKVVLENSVHGQQTVRLWQFFKDYLAIISWTEDTRAQIFSENLNAQGLSEAPWENLKNSMEAKFKEFEELAAAGWELVTEEHYLSETIKERMEELQNMLGWVMVRCQAQCSPKDAGNKNDEQETQDSTLNIPQNLQVSMPPIEVNSTADVAEADGILNFKVLEKCSEGQHHKPQNEPVSTAFALNVLPGYKQSLEESGNGLPFEVDVPKGTLVLEPSETPVLLVPQTAPGSLGGTVSLILSIGKEGEKKAAGSQTAPSPSEGQETLHKVSTYLHVKEKNGCRNQDTVCGNSAFISQSVKQLPPRIPSFPFSRVEWGKATSHTLPKISSSCSKSPKGKAKARTGDIQLLTLQGIMGTKANYLQEERHSMSNTWPPRCSRRVQVLQVLSLPQRELMDYMKNPLEWAIDAECDLVRETSGKHIFLKQNKSLHSPHSPTEKVNTCQHLSLGSVLSLELPKDLSALRNVNDTIKVAREGITERKGANQVNQVAQRSTEEAKSHETSINLQKETLGGQQVMHSKLVRVEDVSHKLPKTKKGTWFEEVKVNPSYGRQKTYFVASSGEVRLHSTSQNNSCDDFLDSKQNKLSHISVLHEQIGLEWDKLGASLGRTCSSKEKQEKDLDDNRTKVQDALRLKLKSTSVESTSNPDLVSNLTRIKDLLVNETPEKENTQCSEESSTRHPLSFLHLGHKSPTQPSKLDCELGYEENTLTHSELCPFNVTPWGDITKGTKLQGMAAEVRHPAHEMFEEEEEELQAIWNNMEKHKRGPDVHTDPGRKIDKEQSPGSSGGKLLLTSADNWLIAKFKLPTSAEMLQNSEGERRASLGVDKRKNRPNQCSKADTSSCQELSKVAAASPGESSLQKMYPVDQQKFQEGKCVSKILPSKLELQMMEGPLERKNLLQAGGRKANSRSWNTFHTVLMRQTLCFYQDKKDTLKSSVMALPLNLSGAVCTLETEYTKKSNCFTLQLNDGSKYLLRAPTEPLMKEWVTKLQQNSGLPEVDFFPSASQPAQGMTSVVSAIPGQGVGHFQSFQKKLSTKSQEIRFLPKSSVKLQLPYNTHSEPLDTTASQTGNGLRSAPIYTTEQNLKQCSPLEPARSQDPQLCQEDDCGLVTGKRRSYSFTSATYQKITPLSKSKEPLGIGNNYSVTLYIGEQAPTTPPRPRCHSFIATPSGARETVGEQNQGASSRQKNKSVFRKFFGKKD
ncbi:uncharacterized protein LOC103058937 isoform X2 [Python bivittatus]|uniref:Uncharacterized protein LOC103058937 isoform X2 n=1 Tax=Python bivittatus TaxID=176946 RepID=A0A9F5N095_PYTBI|nr:uncharacterized protein LOC103058937 isoform X2 [Python bivittatus]